MYTRNDSDQTASTQHLFSAGELPRDGIQALVQD